MWKKIRLRKRTFLEWANFLHMHIAMDKDKTAWAFTSRPKIDLQEQAWIPRKEEIYFSLPENSFSFDGDWKYSLRCPDCNDYEISVEETFELNENIFVCLPSRTHTCEECDLKNSSLCVRAPECMSSIRTDRTDMIFKLYNCTKENE
jgi:hypothetical protein